MTAPMVIVGAGQAGLQIAESLRSEGWDGGIVMVGEEGNPPYHRPPLSKAYLLGEASDAQLTIRAPEVLARKGIELRSGVRVSAIDRAARKLALSDGQGLDYTGLALATGSRARPLPIPGSELGNVFPLRTLEDCHRINAALASAHRVAVIGGGFIGLEFAAVARKKGKPVTVFEAAERLMPRVVAPLISEFYADLHRRHGVDLLLGAKVAQLVGRDGQVSAVRTADGTDHAVDLVVFGIGILPNVELASACGLTCEGGIVVDACSRTSDPQVTAAGDCTAVRLPDGSLRRLESVQNAVEQGKAAAAALLGKEKPFAAAPWFWSDQYDVKLQMVGLSAGHDAVALRGSVGEEKFSAFYYRDGKLIGIDSANRPQDHMVGRKLFAAGVSPTAAQVADPDFNLASLV